VATSGEVVTHRDDQRGGGFVELGRRTRRPFGAWFERGVALGPAAGNEFIDPVFRVARSEQAAHLGLCLVVESFISHQQQAPRPVERIVLTTAMTSRIVLDPAVHLVDAGGNELHDVKWVSDLDRVGEHRVEHVAIRPRQIQRCPTDPIPPHLGPFREPLTRRRSTATRHNAK
jgi:hypothetical protein